MIKVKQCDINYICLKLFLSKLFIEMFDIVGGVFINSQY